MKGIQDFVCLDLETTGLNPKQDRIIEIGMVKVRSGQIADTFSCLLDPRQELDQRIEEITGITSLELKNQPTQNEMLPKILEFLGEDVLLGHRVLFDYSFLKRAFTNEKISFERKGIDTLWLARKLVQDCESKSLPKLCEHYHIEYRAHRALSDALATVRLYQILVEQYYEEELFLPRPLVFRAKKESPITKAQVNHLTQLIEKHGIDLKKEITSLTRNEASRQIDRILSTYGK